MALILLVEDEPSLQLALADTLRDEGYEVTVAGAVAEALSFLRKETPDLVLCDLRLPDGSGLAVLKSVVSETPGVPVVVLTAYGTVAGAVEALQAGAAEYLTKPFNETQLLVMIERHIELRRLRRRVEDLQGSAWKPIGESRNFRQVVELARTVAGSDSTILLHGETGTGKEVLARFVHDSSPRRSKPFVAVNCAALPETLLESELFGHERGAFTGALQQRTGRFEDADGGTLFLDEIAETSPAVQAKLLRVLEERKFERLGSSRSIPVNLRIIAATKRNLEEEVEQGRFRDDLYYRLKVVPIFLPPLRDRAGDVTLLARAFAHRFGAERGSPLEFSGEALQVLARHPFPGNVRELRHLVQRLSVVCPATTLLAAHLPEEYASGGESKLPAGATNFEGTLSELAAGFERLVLARMLEKHGGHRGNVAKALGISRKSLWEKLKAHGLDA